MKKIIRFISFLLAFVMFLCMFSACAEITNPEDTTKEAATDPSGSEIVTEDETTLFVLDDLAESYDFNETITIFLWSDHRMREFHAEESGDIIDDAIYHRNIAVEKRLNITLEFVEEPGDSDDYKNWNKKAENDWQADKEYDIYAGYSRAVPLLAINGMTENLLEHESFSVEKPWWPEALTTECTIKDKLFFCSGDIATSLLWYMDAIMYNKSLYEAHYAGQPTPMDLVEADDWTFEKLFAMTKDIYIESPDGNVDNATYAISIFDTDIDAFQIAAGITAIEKDEDGGIRVSEAWSSQYCADVCQAVGEYLTSPGVYVEGSTKSRDSFFNERCVFHLDRIFIVAGTDTTESSKVEFSYGIVPVPKYNDAQESFKTSLGNPFTIYAVNNNTSNVEAAVTTLEAMGSENYRSVTPAVFEVAMKVRYTDDPQAARMYDILRGTISFDIGRLCSYSFGNSTATLFRNTAMSANPSGFLTQLRVKKVAIDRYIKTFMEAYED
jgi:hypothetical protein